MQHVKHQNWFAVGLDLVIVVFGVWLAFQITEWSEERDQRAETREQLNALQIDLTENLEQFMSHLEYTEQVIQDLVRIRELLAKPSGSADLSVLRGLLGTVFAYDYFEPELAAYEALRDSGNLRILSGTAVGNSISEWQRDVSRMMRDQNVMIDNRNLHTNTLIATNYSLASTLVGQPWWDSMLTSSNFQNSFEELAGNKVLDDVLSVHIVLRNSNRISVEECIESTEALQVQLESFLRN